MYERSTPSLFPPPPAQNPTGAPCRNCRDAMVCGPVDYGRALDVVHPLPPPLPPPFEGEDVGSSYGRGTLALFCFLRVVG